MSLVALILILVLAPIGISAVICTIGWWSTVRVRGELANQMFELRENAKMNALTVEERRVNVLERYRELEP